MLDHFLSKIVTQSLDELGRKNICVSVPLSANKFENILKSHFDDNKCVVDLSAPPTMSNFCILLTNLEENAAVVIKNINDADVEYVEMLSHLLANRQIFLIVGENDQQREVHIDIADCAFIAMVSDNQIKAPLDKYFNIKLNFSAVELPLPIISNENKPADQNNEPSEFALIGTAWVNGEFEFSEETDLSDGSIYLIAVECNEYILVEHDHIAKVAPLLEGKEKIIILGTFWQELVEFNYSNSEPQSAHEIQISGSFAFELTNRKDRSIFNNIDVEPCNFDSMIIAWATDGDSEKLFGQSEHLSGGFEKIFLDYGFNEFSAETMENLISSSTIDEETELNEVNLVWHIDAAVFEFDNVSELEKWVASGKQIQFEFDPTTSDDGGETIFDDPENSTQFFDLDESNSEIKTEISDGKAIISAWVKFKANIREDIGQSEFEDWASESGGISCGTINLQDVEATITSDEGQELRWSGRKLPRNKNDHATVILYTTIDWFEPAEQPDKNSLVPDEFEEAINLWKANSESNYDQIVALLNPYINAQFLPSNIVNWGEIIRNDDNEEFPEISAKLVRITGIDFSNGIIPRCKAEAIFSVPVTQFFSEIELSEWQEENSPLADAVIFSWEIPRNENTEDLDFTCGSHQGLECMIVDQEPFQ